MAEDFDPTQMSDLEILSLPESNVPAGELDAFLARRAEVIEKQETGQTALALDPAHDARQRPDCTIEKQEEQISLQRYLVAMQDIRDREDELIEEIEAEHRQTLRRLKDIDAHAIKLRDGRRAYVDGDEFRDEYGALLRGADRQEAERLKTKTSSTWAEKSHFEEMGVAENRLLDDLHHDRQKMDRSINNGRNLGNKERVADFKEREALVAKYEKEADNLTQSYATDSADEQDTVRSLSFASTLDNDNNRPTITSQFSAAASGRASDPEAQNPGRGPSSPAPTATGP